MGYNNKLGLVVDIRREDGLCNHCLRWTYGSYIDHHSTAQQAVMSWLVYNHFYILTLKYFMSACRMECPSRFCFISVKAPIISAGYYIYLFLPVGRNLPCLRRPRKNLYGNTIKDLTNWWHRDRRRYPPVCSLYRVWIPIMPANFQHKNRLVTTGIAMLRHPTDGYKAMGGNLMFVSPDAFRTISFSSTKVYSSSMMFAVEPATV